MTPEKNKDLAEEIENLPLSEKIALFSGTDAWHFAPVPSLSLPDLQVADCGHGITLVCPPYGAATCLPTSVGMAATWNRELLEEAGAILGREGKAKGLGMVLAPMVNLHRLPCGGRNYETFSEDPVLTGKMSAAIIRGIQSEGLSACIKSFACNNQQKNQQRTSSDVDEKTLRDLYLRVFEIALEESNPWAVMTSYNAINGEHPSDSRHWLNEVLREEYGFKGVIVSDWHSTQGDDALESTMDIEMPGPAKVLTPENVTRALEAGILDTEEIDRRARRIIELYRKTLPARQGDPRFSPPELDSPRHREIAQRVAEEAIVLLKNDGALLPLDRSKIKKIAVVGPNASIARLGGGGSASVLAGIAISPLEGIRAAVGPDCEVVYSEGCAHGGEVPAIPDTFWFLDSECNQAGIQADYFSHEAFDTDGTPVKSQTDAAVNFQWGWAAPTDGAPRALYAIRWTGYIKPPRTGVYTLAVSAKEGIARVRINGEEKLDCWTQYDPGNFEDKYTNRQASAEVELEADKPVKVQVEYKKTGTRAGIRLGWTVPGVSDPAQEAIELAQSADAVIVCAGLSNSFEGGMCDRAEFDLPDQQDEFIQRIAAANPNTVVVLKNGTPVSFENWLKHVPSVLEAFYPGQAGGHAIARVIFGDVNPSGRLPDTIPMSWDQSESMKYYPGVDGHAPYSEGFQVGYRDFDFNGKEPRFPFGFGLSYTQFEMGIPQLPGQSFSDSVPMQIEVEICNTGSRAGKTVVQGYIEAIDRDTESAVRQLFEFKKVSLDAGESQTVQLTLTYRDLLGYDPESRSWKLNGTQFRVGVGPHSRDLKTADFTVGA